MTVGDISVFSGNKSSNLGGGITNFGDLIIVGSTFSSNFGFYGGGFLNYFGTVSVMSSAFSSNSVTYKGGAWANLSSGSSHGSVAFHGSSSASITNTADIDCDISWESISSTCVN